MAAVRTRYAAHRADCLLSVPKLEAIRAARVDKHAKFWRKVAARRPKMAPVLPEKIAVPWNTDTVER